MRDKEHTVPKKRRQFPHMADEYDLIPGDEYRWVAAELRRHLHPRLRKVDIVELNRSKAGRS